MKRRARTIWGWAGRLALMLLTVSLAAGPSIASAAEQNEEGSMVRVYVGTYTSGDSQGIYVLEMDARSGELGEPRLAGELANPSFLAIHPSERWLYAVSEVTELEGRPTGAVAALAIDAESGGLTLLNQQPSEGGAPCHLVVDPSGRNVLVANYVGGNVAVLPIQDDGQLSPASSVVQHEGSSVNPQRQRAPHAHSINLDSAGRFAVAADLGIDQLRVYRFDPQRGQLEPHDPPAASVAPGGGPRHFDFHPSGKFAYANNELTSTVTAFRYDGDRGALEEIHTLSTLPEEFDGNNSTAEIRVHPSGQFLYVSNRGHNSIAMFTIDEQSGRLTAIGHAPSGGRTPRNFNLDPSGRFLLAANQGSDNVVVFRVDDKTGELAPTGHEAQVPAPVCLRMHVVR